MSLESKRLNGARTMSGASMLYDVIIGWLA